MRQVKKELSRAGACCALVMICLLVGSTSAWCQEQVKITFEIPKLSVSLHEPVFVNFQILNGHTEEIRLNLGPGRKQNFQLTIIDPDGVTVRPLQARTGGFTASGQIAIPPGKVYKQTLLLNEWYSFTKVGNYVVQASQLSPIENASGNPVQGLSSEKPLYFQIQPRDADRLKEVCQQLMSQALSSSFWTALEAAITLGYINDPIAVPYLDRVLSGGGDVKLAAIPGLVRIGSAEAVQTLRAHLKSDDPELKRRIKIALEQIQAGNHVGTTR